MTGLWDQTVGFLVAQMVSRAEQSVCEVWNQTVGLKHCRISL